MPNNRVLQNKNYVVTSKYGTRTVNGVKGFHYGNDIVGTGGAADYIVAHSDGVVVFWQNYNKTDLTVNGTNKAYGNCIKLKHPNGYYTLYAHMSALNVKNGESVKKGQVIGHMGNTGYSLGTHLHFEVRNTSNVRIDPAPYINADLPNLPTTTTKDYLSYGDTGNDVGTLQMMLITCGYSCGSSGIDNSFGNGTLTALKKFQTDNGLEADGNYGSASKAKLTTLYNAKKKNVTTAEKAAITEKAIAQMEAWANDNTHGYDQTYRWGQKGDYDCSAAVIQAWENAGVPVKTYGAYNTRTMYDPFIALGFTDVTKSVNLKTAEGLKRGDVLLNTIKHTAMYCGNKKEVEASINEKGTATGGTPGDQTGKEFLIRDYRYTYDWNYVLRYGDGSTATTTTSNKIAVDGNFGTATVKKAQEVFGTTVDGVISNQPLANKVYLPSSVTGAWQFRSIGYTGGSSLIRAIQKKVGATIDGFAGKNFVTCLQKFLKKDGLYTGVIDGLMGTNTVKAFQTWLNKH